MDKLDILNREKDVQRLITLVENISANKSSVSFALNGAWGCGKSFVLDMFQERLEATQSQDTCKDKYFVIRYNSWKFDYYEEPLVAIVAAMISIIEEKAQLFSSDKKLKLLGMLKAVGISLLSVGNSALKEKTGINFKEIYETVSKGKEETAAKFEKRHAYDAYFDLNKVIEKLVDLLQDLAQEYTIIFLVDELDRCLPEYSIKVLERLHHLTEGSKNIITIISIDKHQLLSSVTKTFGFDDPEKYLEKFISFEVKLDNGIVSEAICEKYADYIALFDKDIFPFDDSVEECIQAIFKDIEVRTQEQLVKKAMIAHQLFYSDKKDYSFMCMELILAVMICVYKDNSCFSDVSIDLSSFEKVFKLPKSSQKPYPNFSEFFTSKFENANFRLHHNFSSELNNYRLPYHADLYGAILYTWYWMHKQNLNSVDIDPTNKVYEPILENYKELKKFAETIKMMSCNDQPKSSV